MRLATDLPEKSVLAYSCTCDLQGVVSERFGLYLPH